MLVSISGLRAFWVIAWRFGSTCDSAREFASAITAMRTSAFSAAQVAVGGIHSSCFSFASS